jgi:hypothetical protein
VNVKEWIEKLQTMPGDAEIYEYDGESGVWWRPEPKFVDLDHADFKRAKEYSSLTTVSAESPRL